MARIGTDTITILRAAAVTDEYSGQTRLDWTNPTQNVVTGCYVESAKKPLTDYTNRELVLVEYEAFLPPNTDITALDRVVYAGTTYLVFGSPNNMSGFTGRLNYISVTLQRYTG